MVSQPSYLFNGNARSLWSLADLWFVKKKKHVTASYRESIMGACAERNSPEWVCIQEVTHYRSWFLFLPHSTVISGLWLWFWTIWEWFPMFLWRLSQEKHCGEIESIMGNHVEPSSPLWVCILQKSLAITRDFWNANSPRWTLLCTGAHDGFFMEYKLMRVNSVPHGHPWSILFLPQCFFLW